MVSRSALRGRLLPVGVPSVEDLLYDLIDACAGGHFFLDTGLRAMTRTSLVSRSHMMISERVVSFPWSTPTLGPPSNTVKYRFESDLGHQ